MKVKNSKYKNTGIIFELLVRQITSDILTNRNTPAVNILKKYYNKTEIAKEHKLYQSLINMSSLNEEKANNVISTILSASEKINRSRLRNEKYNLIKEIKENYNIENFFKSKISNYKTYASIFNLLEAHNSPEFTNPDIIISNKNTLLEHLVYKPVEVKQDPLLESFSKENKGTRALIFENVVKKFNEKYSTTLLPEQKSILREYISSVDDSIYLKEYINDKIDTIKLQLEILSERIEDDVIKIKVNEVLQILQPLDQVNEDSILNILNYYSLINEIKKINE